MPIRVRLDRLLLERRISILKTGKARAIRFSTLASLCRELECQPGDLVVFEPGPPGQPDEDEMEE
jgi:putative transcriptional regulator